MKNPTLRLLIATILTACFTSALFADDTETRDTLCSGPWKFTKNSGGWETVRIFNKNGTFTTPANAGETGHWKISGGTIVLTFPDSHKDVMTLPLNPKGTQAFNAHADALTAVLQSGSAPGLNINSLLPAAPLTEEQIAAAKTLLTSAPWKISGGNWAEIRVFAADGTFKTLPPTTRIAASGASPMAKSCSISQTATMMPSCSPSTPKAPPARAAAATPRLPSCRIPTPSAPPPPPSPRPVQELQIVEPACSDHNQTIDLEFQISNFRFKESRFGRLILNTESRRIQRVTGKIEPLH